MRPANRQQGFSLVVAIFIILILATLLGYAVNIGQSQSRATLWSLLGARAEQAARSGLEWGHLRALSDGSCAAFPATLNFPDPVLSGYQVQVSCSTSGTVHREGSTDMIMFQITALAEFGQLSRSDYVSRRLRSTVSAPPP